MNEMLEFLIVVDAKEADAIAFLKTCKTFADLRQSVMSSPSNRDLDQGSLNLGTTQYTKELKAPYCPDYWKKVYGQVDVIVKELKDQITEATRH